MAISTRSLSLYASRRTRPRGGSRPSVPAQLDQLWDDIRDELRRETPDFKFHIWLEPLELAGSERQDALRPRPGAHPHLGRRALPAAAAARGRERASSSRGRRGRRAGLDGARGRRAHADRRSPTRPDGRRLNPKYSFDQFVIGEGNRFAHAASLAVAELPAQAYNPLFLHGAPGLGKTHLLHAIGNYVQRFGSGLRVRYATIEEFTTGFVDAVRRHRTDDFKDDFRGADVVLIDDVQFLAGRTKTREEFFHTFNALLDSGRQLVIIVRPQPRRAARSRGAAGRALPRPAWWSELDPPPVSVRRAILAKRARLDGVEVSADGAGRDRAARGQQRACARGRADPRRRLCVAQGRGRRRPRWSATCCAAWARTRPPTPTACREIIDAAAQEFGVQRESLLARDRRPDRRHRAPGRHVPRARADRAQPSRDRTRDRRPQPHHRAPCREPGQRCNAYRPSCAQARSTTCTAVSAAERDGRCQCDNQQPSFPFQQAEFAALSTYRQALLLQGQVADVEAHRFP